MNDIRLREQTRPKRPGHSTPPPEPPRSTEPAWLAQAALERPDPPPASYRVARPCSPEVARTALRLAVKGARVEIAHGGETARKDRT